MTDAEAGAIGSDQNCGDKMCTKSADGGYLRAGCMQDRMGRNHARREKQQVAVPVLVLSQLWSNVKQLPTCTDARWSSLDGRLFFGDSFGEPPCNHSCIEYRHVVDERNTKTTFCLMIAPYNDLLRPRRVLFILRSISIIA